MRSHRVAGHRTRQLHCMLTALKPARAPTHYAPILTVYGFKSICSYLHLKYTTLLQAIGLSPVYIIIIGLRELQRRRHTWLRML